MEGREGATPGRPNTWKARPHLQGRSGRWGGQGLRGRWGSARTTMMHCRFQSSALFTVSSKRSTYNLYPSTPFISRSLAFFLTLPFSLSSPSHVPLSHPLRPIHRRPRNRITRKRPIKIEQDPRIRRGIQPHHRHTRRLRGAAALNIKVHTLRVILCPVRLSRRMQRDNLMAQDILPRRDISRYLNSPGIVIRDQRVGGPITRVATGKEADAVDLEPPQCSLID